GALAQQRTGERLQTRGVARIGLAPGISGTVSAGKPGHREVDQLRVGEQLEVGIQNARRRPRAGALLYADLLPGALERGVEVRALALGTQALLLDADRGAAHLRGFAQRKSGRCAHARKLAGVGRT